MLFFLLTMALFHILEYDQNNLEKNSILGAKNFVRNLKACKSLK